jgi:hypothetical protein
MLTDDQLGERLFARLTEATQDVYAAPDLAATVRRAHDRRTLTRAVLAVPLAAVTVAAVSLVAASNADGVHAPPSASSSAPAVLDVAYVTAMTDAALAKTSDAVLRLHAERTLGKNSPYHWEQVIDQKTGQYRHDSYAGATMVLSVACSARRGGASTLTVVDYTKRTWWSEPGPGLPIIDTLTSGYEEPENLRAALKSGKVTIVGAEPLNGRSTLHLQITNPWKGPRLAIYQDLWVDPKTYLPVRLSWVNVWREVSKDTIVLDYEWLPRTPENRGELELTPPAGFRKVSTGLASPSR